MSNYVNLMDIVYPVGSVYISFHSASPASSIGGTWTQITDKVLRASTNTNTGGEDTHINLPLVKCHLILTTYQLSKLVITLLPICLIKLARLVWIILISLLINM